MAEPTNKPQYALARVHAPSGNPVQTLAGDPVYVRIDPRRQHDRVRAAVLELDIDRCRNTFGTSPCTASGTPCYNTFATCRDKVNFKRGVQTYRFGLRGQPIPAGAQWRPYITTLRVAPTTVNPTKGLAIRSRTTVNLVDEPDNDTEGDPYKSQRSTPAQGTFWTRFLARNPNAVGRAARLKRGFYAEPFTDDYFVTEHYIIDAVAGPDDQGNVEITLADPLKLLDRATVPASTDGTLSVALKVAEYSGAVASAVGDTLTFAPGASPTDGAYTGMELAITAGLGTGQTRMVTAYNGATLTATLDSAWLTTPDTSSTAAVRALSITLGNGRGSQYAMAPGARGFVRIGSEIIEYTSRVGDVLSWPSHAAYRGRFGSTVAEHDADESVQLCKAWIDASPADVLTDLLTTASSLSGVIDTAGLETETLDWLSGARITTCLSEPLKVSDLLAELSQDLGLMLWWEPVSRRIKFVVNVPRLQGATASYGADQIIQGSAEIERLDADRLTQTALYYDLRDATANVRDSPNFARAEVRVDGNAESAFEYGDQRSEVRRSRWMTAANVGHVRGVIARRLAAVRDAPVEISFDLDKLDQPVVGALVDVSVAALTDAAGARRTVRSRVTELSDQGTHYAVTARTTTFGTTRWAFIAPAGQPDYAAASAAQRAYAYISDTDGLMLNGDDGYRII